MYAIDIAHVLGLVAVVTGVAAQTCYNYDGSVHVSATPCTPNAVSHCCSPWDTCVGDGMCLSQYGTLYLESCTDKTFQGDGCPTHCVESRKNGTAQTGDIIPCGYDNGWQFCCGLGCCTGSNPPTFRIGNATNIYEDRLECAIEGISTTKASSSSAPTSTNAGAASATTAQPSGGTITATTIPANDCATSSDDSNTKIVYGAGLGVGLGVPLLLALGLLYFEHRKRIRAEGQLAGMGGASAAPAGATYAPAYSDPKYQPVSSEAAVVPSELQGQSVAQELAAARQYRRS